MKYIAPASFAPGPLLSEGIIASAIASTSACSLTLSSRNPVIVCQLRLQACALLLRRRQLRLRAR